MAEKAEFHIERIIPEWGKSFEESGSTDFSIDILKNGLVLEKLDISTHGQYILGRMEPVVDVVLEHPSISRKHAIFQYNQQGELFLFDLGSTHGTFVNKKRIPAKEYLKINVGDLVQFGESKRFYTVCGPDSALPQEYDSEHFTQLRLQKVKKRKEMAERKLKQEEIDSGISWGFGEDAPDYPEEDDSEEEDDNEDLPEYLKNSKSKKTKSSGLSSLDIQDINAKDTKIFDKIQAKRQKVENMTIEIQRIEAKQYNLGDGLTQGQTNTMERNHKHIEKLQNEILELENTIRDKNKQRATSSKIKSKPKTAQSYDDDDCYDYNSDEDDFYDRTARNKNKNVAPQQKNYAKTKKEEEIMTEDSLRKKVEQVTVELSNLIEKEAGVNAEIERKKRNIQDEGDVDSLDAYMLGAAKNIQKDELNKIFLSRKRLSEEKVRLELLLKKICPALNMSEPIKIREKLLITDSKTEIKNNSQITTGLTEEKDEMSVEEVVDVSPIQGNLQSSNKRKNNQIDEEDFEPAKSICDTKVVSTGSLKNATPLKSDQSSKKKQKKVYGVAARDCSPKGSTNYAQLSGEKFPKDELEGGDQVWVPPKDQTGDGRTALNDKFGY